MPELQIIIDLFDELMGSRLHAFPALRENLEAPNRRGVYVIYSPRGRVVHVGRTTRARDGIRQRLRGHMSGASSFTKRHLRGRGRRLRRGYTYRYLEVRRRRRRALLEAYATGQLCPAHLGLG